jgi:hypothetical protein
VREPLDPRDAKGFGILSAHEVETDRQLAWIHRLLRCRFPRVVKFAREGIMEVGHFISPPWEQLLGNLPDQGEEGSDPLLMSDGTTDSTS